VADNNADEYFVVAGVADVDGSSAEKRADSAARIVVHTVVVGVGAQTSQMAADT